MAGMMLQTNWTSRLQAVAVFWADRQTDCGLSSLRLLRQLSSAWRHRQPSSLQLLLRPSSSLRLLPRPVLQRRPLRPSSSRLLPRPVLQRRHRQPASLQRPLCTVCFHYKPDAKDAGNAFHANYWRRLLYTKLPCASG